MHDSTTNALANANLNLPDNLLPNENFYIYCGTLWKTNNASTVKRMQQLGNVFAGTLNSTLKISNICEVSRIFIIKAIDRKLGNKV